MGNLLFTIDRANLIEGVDRRRQTSMNAKDSVFNDGRKAEVIKNLCAISRMSLLGGKRDLSKKGEKKKNQT